MATRLVEEFGKGVFAILALEGYRGYPSQLTCLQSPNWQDGRRTVRKLNDFLTFSLPKSQRAMGYAYKFFIDLSAEETLEALLDSWRSLVRYQEASSGNGSTSNNSTLPPNSASTALPTGLLNSVIDLCNVFDNLAKSETQGFVVDVGYWNILHELGQQKAKFMAVLDKMSTTEAKLDKIVGRRVESHVLTLYRAIAKGYGFGEKSYGLRARQAQMISFLIKVFGKGITGPIATEGFESFAQSAQHGIVGELARWIKEQTKVQLIFDHIAVNLVEPMLAGEKLYAHGVERLGELVDTNNWRCLDG